MKILDDSRFTPHIEGITVLPEREAVTRPFPDGIDERLREALSARGIDELYEHQALAYESARAWKHTVVVTPTASGKTLCYNLPVMQSLLENPSSGALYLFPTKALSQDQQSEINELAEQIGRAHV